MASSIFITRRWRSWWRCRRDKFTAQEKKSSLKGYQAVNLLLKDWTCDQGGRLLITCWFQRSKRNLTLCWPLEDISAGPQDLITCQYRTSGRDVQRPTTVRSRDRSRWTIMRPDTRLQEKWCPVSRLITDLKVERSTFKRRSVKQESKRSKLRLLSSLLSVILRMINLVT